MDQKEALDDPFTQILGVLTHRGLVELQRVAQDGMKVRASAGAASFRREKSLTRCLEEARQQVEEAAREALPGEDVSARRQAARERAATAETTNADLRCNRALDRFLVRGLPKVRCVVLWAPLTYNILKLIAVA